MNHPTGFSFTTMFFGPFPVLFRGDYKLAGWLLLIFIASLLPVIGWLMFPIFFIAPAVINRVYASRANGGETKPFPMQPDEVKAALIYFVVWLAVVTISFMTIGAAVMGDM